ncbi:hypothetical protein HCX50_19685, partial [Microbacterium oxydans]|uniref:hypothetical protein n=1 Tax=Microbacterium sp. B19(2022) TaxID=2914045 RepID=UPI001431AFE8
LPVRIVRVEFLGEIVEYEAEVLTEGEPVATIVGRGAPLATPPRGRQGLPRTGPARLPRAGRMIHPAPHPQSHT